LRSSLPLALLMVLAAVRPAASVLTDNEPSNNAIGTAGIQMVPTAAVTADGGELRLVYNDIDYLGIGNLRVGDIVTISTTPLDDVKLEDPDTLIGLFTSGGSRKCESEDSLNNEIGSPASAGFGSLCRYVIDSAGTWYVGVTGSGDPPFDGNHYQNGVYELHVTIDALNPPSPTATPTVTPAATPTPTPTPEPGLTLQFLSGAVGLAWLRRRRNRRVGAKGRGQRLRLGRT